MKPNRLLCLLCSLGLLLSTTACHDFLEKVPQSALTPDNFYNNNAEATAAINGVYYRLSNFTGTYAFRYQLMSELTTDDFVWARAAGTLVTINTYTFDSSLREIASVWEETYQMIAYANSVIKNVPKAAGVTESLRKRIEAEARFLRATGYFNLVRFFGDVPLVTQPYETLDNLQVPRDPVQKVYDQIIEDGLFAEQNLPKKTEIVTAERGRAAQGAAKAMLAKVYLTMASPGTKGITADKKALYQKAADKCKEILDGAAGSYTLLADYGSIFAKTNEYNNEVLFDVQYKSGLGQGATGAGAIFGGLFVPLSVPTGQANMTPRAGLYDSFPPNDKRRAWGFWTEFIDPAGKKYTFDQPYVYKYVDIEQLRLNNGADGGINFILYRLGDVYLMYAEALNELGRTAEAYPSINAIRKRAGIADVAAGLSQADFRNTVWQERRWELFAEGTRRFDLVRENRLVEAVRAVGDANNKIQDFHVLLPIPQREINTNKAPGFVQNPGY